jgi:hypothetical protein
MTVIAFDGRFVASDKMATSGVRQVTVRKLWLHGRKVLACDGHAGHGMALVKWYIDGAKPSLYPPLVDADNWASLHVFEHGKPIWVYERIAHPVVVHDDLFASGSGGAHAMGAMAAGASARRAVEIACEYADGCGKGVDVIDLMGLVDGDCGSGPHAGLSGPGDAAP